MKHLSIIFLLIIQFNYSQNSGVIEYLATTNFAFPYSTVGVLEFNTNSSKFTLLKSSKTDKETVTKFEENKLEVYLPESKNRPTYYLSSVDKTLISKVQVFQKSYYVEEKAPEIDWEIVDDYKNINDIKCQKAIGNFRGRTYTAWFSDSIPLPYGPWKLHGLPGLILEVKDEMNQVFFKVKKINLKEFENLPFDKTRETIDIKKFISEFLPEKYKEMEALINAKAGNRNTSVSLGLPDRYNSKEIKYEWEEKED